MTELKGKVRDGGHMTGKQKDDYISSLITTIESQKEEIEEFKEFQGEVKDEYDWMNRLLNAGNKREKRLEDQIESLQKELDKVKEGQK